MNRLFIFIDFFFITILFSCSNKNEKLVEPAPLYPQPRIVKLDTTNGYFINVVTEDSIKEVINSEGDTVKTGTPIFSVGKLMDHHFYSVPKNINAGIPKSIEFRQNIHKIPDNLSVIPLDTSKLKRIKLGDGKKDFVMINSIGDTVKTGIPTPMKGKKVRAIQPKPVTALPPRMKDNSLLNIQFLDVDQGMNSSYLTFIHEDKKGNIWFGTWGGGVSMYDGVSFLHYTKKEGLSNNYVLSILEDKNGNFWFGTNGGGVCEYDGKEFTHYTESEGLSSNVVVSVIEDKNGNILIGTLYGGFCMYDGKSIITFTEKEGLINNNVISIYEDNNENIWLGLAEGGVCKFDEEYFVEITKDEGLGNNYVLSILEDRNGNIWFGTLGGGINKYDGESIVNFTEKEGLSNNNVRFISEDSKGNIWIGTWGNGVDKFDGEYFINYSENEGLTDNTVRYMHEDKCGNLWFGTWGGGVSIYCEESFVHLTENEGLNNITIRSIYEDESGNLWIGSYGGGVIKFDGERFFYFTEKEGLSNNNVLAILEDKMGNLWFGTYGGGVSKFDGQSFINYSVDEGLSSNFVFTICEDKRGNIWIGTEDEGVCVIEPSINGQKENIIHIDESNGLSNNIVRCIYEDRKGNIWFGSDGGGVSKYSGESFTHYTEREGLSNNSVVNINEDFHGNIWIGTDGGGVNIFNGKSFLYFTEKEGLSSNNVWSIQCDTSNINNDIRCWVGTEKGLNYFILDSEDILDKLNDSISNYSAKTKSFKGPNGIYVYLKNDGLKAIDFNINSVFKDRKNRIWWGTGKGLSKLDLSNFNISETEPKVRLKNLDINEEIIDYRNINEILDNEINFYGVERYENYPLELELPYDRNHLTFHFAAIDWSAPYKIHYSYVMEGLNENWSIPSTETKADYRNLPYGTYTFKVRAIGETQKWGEEFQYKFTIHPPWWNTNWFRVCLVLFLFILLYLLYRWRTSTLRERQKKLEKTVEERTAEIVHQKDIIEEKHKEITDSINYAERIQKSFLATQKMLDDNLEEYFVFFKPKDVVSGDFYWSEKLSDGKFCIAAADSTGHGVPGAIMSILNITCLENAVKEGLKKPSEILDHTRINIIERLKKDGSIDGGKDGMDCSLLAFDFKNNKLNFALANNPLWLIRNGELKEFNADKMPVGKHDKQNIPFSHFETELRKRDIIFIFTDGYADQFGGPKGKKFKYSSLQKLLIENADKELSIFNFQLSTAFEQWKGELEQVDDVCVIGIRL